MAALLEVDNLVKKYGGLTAVDGLSFDVQPGEAFGLLGPNGAGKSTTMMMVCGLLAADSGEVRVEGRRLERTRPDSRQRMGVVPQDLALYPDLTARENLTFFGSLYHLAGTHLSRRLQRRGARGVDAGRRLSRREDERDPQGRQSDGRRANRRHGGAQRGARIA